MALSFGRKISLFTATAALASALAAGATGYALLDRGLTEAARSQAAHTNRLVAGRVGSELRDLAERARAFAAIGEADPLSQERKRFFEGHEEILGLSLLKAPQAPSEENGGQDPWSPVFRWNRPSTAEGDDRSEALSATDFEALELKFPIDWERVAEGGMDLVFAQGPQSGATGGNDVMRLALPYGPPKGGDASASGPSHERAILIELRPARFLSLFAQAGGKSAAAAISTLLIGPAGQLIAQGGPAGSKPAFTPGQDLSQLKIVRWARATGNAHGAMDYAERPGGPIHYASFEKITLGPSAYWVVTQSPRARFAPALRRCLLMTGAIGLVFALLASAWSGWMTSRWISEPLRMLRGALVEHWPSLAEASRADASGERRLDDEIERLADALETVCEDLDLLGPAAGRKMADARAVEAAPPPSPIAAKVKDPAVRALVDSGEIRAAGQKLEAVVVCARLYQIDALAREASDPAALLQTLAEYHRRACDAIEARGGIVDRMQGGTLIAYWGLPQAQDADVESALDACQLIRAAAAQFPTPVSMAIHRGEIIAGQSGPPDRLEFCALGDAIETVERVASFADQLGADLVLTGDAARLAPAQYGTARLTAGDDVTPELFEVSAAAMARAG